MDRGEVALCERDQARYARHIVLPGFGEEAQRKLRGSRVLVVGAGGLGSPVLLYLAAAGIGHLTIIDDDVVDESNLQRQVIHRQADVGRPKALSAREAVQFWPGRGPMLRDLFPEVPAADSVPSAVVGGTFGPVVGETGSMMATEAVKVLAGIGTPAVGRLVLLDALGVGTRTLSFAPDPDRAPVTQLVDGGR